MKKYYIFYGKPRARLEEILLDLSPLHPDITHTIAHKENNQISLGAFVAAEEPFPPFTHIERYELYDEEVDWAEQWQAFSPYYKEGVIEIPLSDFHPHSPLLQLKPGPGFGDLSHPTTYLMLQMMGQYVPHHGVLDVGCGSGILSLAAALMDATIVQGIDIDEKALCHAEENACFNNLQKRVFFSPKLNPALFADKDNVLLMNMTFAEQKTAWETIEEHSCLFSILLCSGILTEQKNTYINWMQSKNFKIKESRNKDKWTGCIFEKML